MPNGSVADRSAGYRLANPESAITAPAVVPYGTESGITICLSGKAYTTSTDTTVSSAIHAIGALHEGIDHRIRYVGEHAADDLLEQLA